MKIIRSRMYNIRCFEDSGDLTYSRKINLFVGANNSGKTTLIKGLLAFQGFGFQGSDFRVNANSVFAEIECVYDHTTSERFRLPVGHYKSPNPISIRMNYQNAGAVERKVGDFAEVLPSNGLLSSLRPGHLLVPFLSKRKAVALSEQINAQFQAEVKGTFDNLNSRIDLLSTAGHPKHAAFQEAISRIVGIPIATKASPSGKVAGAFIDDDTFIELSQMGDGITELVALIVELVLERGKVFVIEEPETSMHPSALKAILSLIKSATEWNQFFITTHSNIVVAELAGDPECELFRVSRLNPEVGSPSVVEKIPHDDHEARRALLADLGYELSDFGLYDAWLFFEESSAERVYMDLLLPLFAPELQGRVRSFSANGAGGLAKKIDLFLTMITFVYLQPIYVDRLWVTADGCEAGLGAIESIRNKFANISRDRLINFQHKEFEYYYPIQFRAIVDEISQIENKQLKRDAKKKLLNEVLTWHRADPQSARPLWEETAAEHIALLRQISAALNG